mgnify:FL=1
MIGTRARENTCCFTGHRPDKLPWGLDENSAECRKLRIEIAIQLEALHSAGIAHFISGMALGCDLLFAEAVLAMREEYDDVTLEAAVPCDSQANSWPEEQKERYNAILSSCDTVTFVQHQYTPGCMLRRNRYMVDNSSVLLACFNGSSGGTMNTLLYARRQGVKTIIIDI